MSEFKLSDKVYDSFMLSLKKVIKVEDVKEFIRLLKEYVNKFKCEECCLESIFIKEIDNLVGDLK